MQDIKIAKQFHFIGIGGISMSGLARALLARGCKVSGSDVNSTDLTKSLELEGILINYGHVAQNIPLLTDVVVKTSTVPIDNPELLESSLRGLPVVERYELLNYLSQFYKVNLGVAGSNGKTTTTAYLWKLLTALKLRPSLFLGSSVRDNEISGNSFERDSDYAVYETDESDASFERMLLNHSIITNIDKDHLEFYNDSFDLLKKSFKNFAKNIILQNGYLVIGIDTEASYELFFSLREDDEFKEFRENIFSYSLSKPEADFFPSNINHRGLDTILDICFKGDIVVKKFKFPSFCEYNIFNLTGAFALAFVLNGKKAELFNPNMFEGFKGIDKRFMPVGKFKNIDIIDDYAHNPAKIKAVIDSLNSQKNWDKVLIVFEPHKYTRLASVYQDFIETFKNSKFIYIMDIFGVAGGLTTNITKETLYQDIATNSDGHIICGTSNQNLYNEIYKIVKDDLEPCKTAAIVFIGAGLSSYYAKHLEAEIKKIYTNENEK
jgi:UDP-N-acetylmuramate--alanine ligase